MYLPNSLYQRAPQYWLFVGMLLVVLGVYLGIQVDAKFMVLGVGLGTLSCVWGVRILVRRARRPGGTDIVGASSTAD
jgi:hypothetical protein